MAKILEYKYTNTSRDVSFWKNLNDLIDWENKDDHYLRINGWEMISLYGKCWGDSIEYDTFYILLNRYLHKCVIITGHDAWLNFTDMIVSIDFNKLTIALSQDPIVLTTDELNIELYKEIPMNIDPEDDWIKPAYEESKKITIYDFKDKELNFKDFDKIIYWYNRGN